MHKTLEYTEKIREAFDLEAEGVNAGGPRNRAEWARMMAVEMKKQGIARTKGVTQANGEAVPPPTEKFLHNALTIPDLAAVEASLDRNRLLLESGTDVAAMALDATISIQASNSLERMLVHQMAAAHKLAMEQMGQVSDEHHVAAQAKRMNAAVDVFLFINRDCWLYTRCGKTDSNASWCNTSMSAKAARPSSKTLRETVEGMWSLNLLCPRADCPRGDETGYGFGGCEIFFRRMGRDAKDDCHGALSKIPDPITQAIFATAGVEV